MHALSMIPTEPRSSSFPAFDPDPADTPIDRIRPWRSAFAQAYEARGVRRDLFGHNILGDPAWDILLSLVLAACDDREMTVGALCAAARGSMTTSLRVIDYLCDRDLIVRHRNPRDRRSFLVTISETGLGRMAALLERSAERARASAFSPVEYPTCLI